MKDVKKVSFRVRRIYYDQFVNGTKHEELRTLKSYWVKILQPYLPFAVVQRLNLKTDMKSFLERFGIAEFWSCENQPKIAVISTPGQPTLRFKIDSIWIDEPEHILGRKLSEQGKKDILTELCIVTKMGERIE